MGVFTDLASKFRALKGAPAGDVSAAGSAIELPVQILAPVEKLQPELEMAFGWLYVARDKSGNQIVDHSGEIVPIHELELASYKFVQHHRRVGAMHMKGSDGLEIPVGELAECVVFTPEKKRLMGIPDGCVPDGMWIGVKVASELWPRVKSGDLRMFSFNATCMRRPVVAI